MNVFEYVTAWLMAFGLSFSMAVTDGPFGWYAKLRKKIEAKYGENSWQATGVGCPICISFWVSAPIAFFMGGGVSMWLSCFGFVTVVMALSPD